MPNVKISDLPAAGSAAATQEFEINDSGTSRKVTGTQVRTFVETTTTALVPSTRTLTGGTGINTIGDLSADRTLNLTDLAAGSTTLGALRYNGTTRAAGKLYGGTTNPVSTTRLNYDGAIHATSFVGDGSGLTGLASGASEQYVDGTLTLTPATDADITLTTEQALFGRIVLNTGAWTIARSIIVPDAEKLRVVKVAGTYAATVKTAAGTGVPVGSGQEATLYCDGTNVDYQTKREFNAAGAAPVFACRAWVQFSDGAPPTINGSGNVSSVTKPGTGRYVVNFTTAMVDADYGIGGIAGTTPTSIALDGAPTTTSLPIKTLTTSLANAQYASIAVFR